MKLDDAVRASLRRRADAVRIDEEAWDRIAGRLRDAQPAPAPSRRSRLVVVLVALAVVVVPFSALWFAFRSTPTRAVGGANAPSLIAFERTAFPDNSVGPLSGNPEQSIFGVSPDGASVERLSPDDGADYGAVAWSPDGTQLAFDRFERIGDRFSEGIFIMDADGSNMHEIYRSLLAPVSVQDISWSPDGSRIAFVREDRATSGSDTDDRMDVVVMDADGSRLHQVTDGIQVTNVAWSPDGSRLAMTRQTLQADGIQLAYDVVVQHLDGPRGSDFIVATAHGDSSEPAWSPDGSQLAFVRSTALGSNDRTSDVMLASIAGSDATALTHVEPGTVAGSPVWSPDGLTIAFTTYAFRDRSCSISSVSPSGGAVHPIADGSTLGGCPGELSWRSVAAPPPTAVAPTPSVETPSEEDSDGAKAPAVDTGDANYLFTDVTVRAGYNPPGPDESDPSKATVSYRFGWQDDAYPGDHECRITVLDAGGDEIGRLTAQFASLLPHPGSASLGVSVTGDPADARIACDPERLDTAIAYTISNEQVTGPITQGDGETAIGYRFDLGWPVQPPEYPGTNTCTVRLVDASGATAAQHVGSYDAPPTTITGALVPKDPSALDEVGSLTLSVECHPWTETDLLPEDR
jgi:hypothetical protein